MGIAPFQQAEALLEPAQATRRVQVAGEIDRQAQLEAVDQQPVQGGKFVHPGSREGAARSDLLAVDVAGHTLDQVAGLLQVDRQFDGLGPASAVALVQVVARHARQVQLDRRVERIDVVVETAHLAGQLLVAGVDQHQQVLQHLLDDVAHAQELAGGVGQRQGRGVQGGGVQVPRPQDGLGAVLGRQHGGTEACQGPGQRQEQQAAHQVVGDVEADHHLGVVEVIALQPVGQQADPGQHQDAAGELEQQAAHRHPPCLHALLGRAHQRQHAAAQVGAHHQAQRHLERDDPGAGQGSGEQHRRQAGIGDHGEDRAGQGVEQLVTGQRREQHLDPGRMGHRRGGFDDQLQRQDDQPQADGDPAELAGAGLLATEKEHHAKKDQQRRQPGQVEGQHPRHQRGAHVGAEHDGQRRGERHQALGDEGGHQQRGGVAALHQGGDGDTGKKGQWHALHAAAEHPAQAGTVYPQDAGTHDMGAPHQQGHSG